MYKRMIIGLLLSAAAFSINSAIYEDPVTESNSDKTKQLISLIEENPEVLKMQDEYDNTLIYYAIEENRPDIVKLLIDKGAAVNVQNQKRMSPLYTSALTGNKEIAKLLIEAGANINTKNEGSATNTGSTALHAAAQKGNKDIVRLLLENEADRDLKDESRLTAADLAKTQEIKDLINNFDYQAHKNKQTLVGSTINLIKRKRSEFPEDYLKGILPTELLEQIK